MMKRVMVVGAGAGGLAALRSLSKQVDRLSFVAYEQSDRVGGTWIHNDPHKPTSMYDNLRTNLPKEVMAYPGFPFPTSIRESFIGHKTVLDYLENFAQHYQLHQYIKFRHTVIEVDPQPLSDLDTNANIWNVAVKDELTGNTYTHQYDAIILCNGHYAVPLIPNINGSDTYTGKFIHSHYYRKPEEYTDKTVLILGVGPSGLDICLDINNAAKKIYLSHNKDRIKSVLPGKIEEIVGISHIAGDDIVLLDDQIVHADIIILATGYRFDFPFLSDICRPDTSNEMIHSIYKVMVDIKHPSRFYIGTTTMTIPFVQMHYQTEYAVGLITGDIPYKTKREMRKQYGNHYKSFVTQAGKPERAFHHMLGYQWHYNRELAVEAGLPMPDSCVEHLYNHVKLITRTHHLAEYKGGIYRMKNSEEFEIVYEPWTT